MCGCKDLVKENEELRDQIIELSRSIRRVQDQAADEEISTELKLLLASIPVTSLSAPSYNL